MKFQSINGLIASQTVKTSGAPQKLVLTAAILESQKVQRLMTMPTKFGDLSNDKGLWSFGDVTCNKWWHPNEKHQLVIYWWLHVQPFSGGSNFSIWEICIHLQKIFEAQILRKFAIWNSSEKLHFILRSWWIIQLEFKLNIAHCFGSTMSCVHTKTLNPGRSGSTKCRVHTGFSEMTSQGNASRDLVAVDRNAVASTCQLSRWTSY